MKKIPFLDLYSENKKYKSLFINSFKRCLEKSNFIKGNYNYLFQEKLKKKFKTRYALAVKSGTDALFICMKYCDLKPGDEVLMTSNTWISAAYAISLCGAKPVFVDIVSRNYQMCLIDLKRKINKKTKAIVVTHLFGCPNDINQIVKICKKYNIFIIEDLAQAHLAKYGGKYVGSLSDMAIFSFYPSKNLGALGDGGAIITNSKNIYKFITKFANYGSENFKDIDHKMIGINSRLDEIQASFLFHKIDNLRIQTNKRKKLAKIYDKFCKKNKIKNIILNKNEEAVYHLYPIEVNNRDKFIRILKRHNIYLQIHYKKPIHLQKAFKYLKYKKSSLPITEIVSKRIVSLPFFPEMKRNDYKYLFEKILLVNKFKEFF